MIYQTNLRHDFIPRECNLLYRDMFCNTPWLYFDFFPIILIVNGSRSEILKPWDWNLHFSFVLPEPLSLFVKLAHFREDHPVNLEPGSCQKLFANSCSVQSKGQGDRDFSLVITVAILKVKRVLWREKLALWKEDGTCFAPWIQLVTG